MQFLHELSEVLTAFWTVFQVTSAAVLGREVATVIPYDRSSLLFTTLVLFSS